jgi:uncharacterized membrane protein YuzA (DUF378 family)
MATVNMLSRLLVIVGGLNWGLAVFGQNVVEMIFSAVPNGTTVVYALVGVSALYEAYRWMCTCK